MCFVSRIFESLEEIFSHVMNLSMYTMLNVDAFTSGLQIHIIAFILVSFSLTLHSWQLF